MCYTSEANTDNECRLLFQLLLVVQWDSRDWHWVYIPIIIIIIMVITTSIWWLLLKVRHLAVYILFLINLLSCRVDVVFTCNFHFFRMIFTEASWWNQRGARQRFLKVKTEWRAGAGLCRSRLGLCLPAMQTLLSPLVLLLPDAFSRLWRSACICPQDSLIQHNFGRWNYFILSSLCWSVHWELLAQRLWSWELMLGCPSCTEAWSVPPWLPEPRQYHLFSWYLSGAVNKITLENTAPFIYS